jgi:hypothetical protein
LWRNRNVTGARRSHRSGRQNPLARRMARVRAAMGRRAVRWVVSRVRYPQAEPRACDDFSMWTQRSYELVHNMRNDDPLRNHRVIPRLSTGIDRLFHFPTFRCVLPCLSRMRGTSHPETGPKRPSNPPRPCQARVAPAKAAQGQRSLRTQGLRARSSDGVGHSVRGDAAKRR